MARIAHCAIVVWAALPMLAPPGWCCMLQTRRCHPAVVDQRAAELGHSAAPAPQRPACCARRAASRAGVGGAAGPAAERCATVCRIDVPACNCCRGVRAAVITIAAPKARAIQPACCWFAASAAEPGALAPAIVVGCNPRGGGRSLQVLQCVWRC